MHCHASCIALALEVVIQLMCSMAEPKHLVMHQYGQRDSNLQVICFCYEVAVIYHEL